MNKIIFILFFLLIVSCGKSSGSFFLQKGKEHYKKENYQMAIRFFEKALAVDSTINDAKYYKAICYYNLGNTRKACEEMVILLKNGYAKADSTLKKIGCFYLQDEITIKKIK